MTEVLEEARFYPYVHDAYAMVSMFMLSVGIFAASERACMNISGGSSPSSAKMQRSA